VPEDGDLLARPSPLAAAGALNSTEVEVEQRDRAAEHKSH
jgi:hypothetical protein